MIISIIAAISKNRVIGDKNNLPWHLPADFAHFRALTLGKPIVMGQKTFESIGKPLPGRKNIVLTLDSNFAPEGVTVAHSIGGAVETAKNYFDTELLPQAQHEVRRPEVMICGGASIYKQFLSRANRMYLTLVQAEFDGDAYFPEWDPDEWQEVAREDHQADDKNLVDYSFVILERKI